MNSFKKQYNKIIIESKISDDDILNFIKTIDLIKKDNIKQQANDFFNRELSDDELSDLILKLDSIGIISDSIDEKVTDEQKKAWTDYTNAVRNLEKVKIINKKMREDLIYKVKQKMYKLNETISEKSEFIELLSPKDNKKYTGNKHYIDKQYTYCIWQEKKFAQYGLGNDNGKIGYVSNEDTLYFKEQDAKKLAKLYNGNAIDMT